MGARREEGKCRKTYRAGGDSAGCGRGHGDSVPEPETWPAVVRRAVPMRPLRFCRLATPAPRAFADGVAAFAFLSTPLSLSASGFHPSADRAGSLGRAASVG